ncbi:hypothetical protein EAH89_05395 [Roseomonas nepalensis]|uniref:Uncharacterized protein n=1 Tax=Muricoccus nepalensis TaxID=1854500 RepID=A0A502GDE9_9PROT|nr:hypothetical protein [Roseomonas nepalensis]TPG59672.1 hypothetical protein EAH89_05395 [Roseomonas nepalensis]
MSWRSVTGAWLAACLSSWPACRPALGAGPDGLPPDPSTEVVAFCRAAGSACECSLEGVETLLDPATYARFLAVMHRAGALTGNELAALERQRRSACDAPAAGTAATERPAPRESTAGLSTPVGSRAWHGGGPRRSGPAKTREGAP